jgi:hypothetical protein
MSNQPPDSEIGRVDLEFHNGDQPSATIRLSGEFDLTNAAKIREAVTTALNLGCKTLQLDMSEVWAHVGMARREPPGATAPAGQGVHRTRSSRS